MLPPPPPPPKLDKFDCYSDLKSTPPPDSPAKESPRAYCLKIINPVKKNQFITAKLQGSPKYCKTVAELKSFVNSSVEPGHGAKGKRCWLYTESDLKDMYEKHARKMEVLLWCYSDSSGSTGSVYAGKGKEVRACQYNNHTKKMAEVDDIVEELEKKHHGKYSPEQFRTWAQIHVHKHESHDEPPDKPFIRGTKRPCPREQESCTSPKGKRPATTAISPAQRLNMRSELIDQLQKWHNFREMGAISPQEHDDLQQTILKDLRNL